MSEAGDTPNSQEKKPNVEALTKILCEKPNGLTIEGLAEFLSLHGVLYPGALTADECDRALDFMWGRVAGNDDCGPPAWHPVSQQGLRDLLMSMARSGEPSVSESDS